MTISIHHKCPHCSQEIDFQVTLGKPSFDRLEQDDPAEVDPTECPHCDEEIDEDTFDTVITQAEEQHHEGL